MALIVENLKGVPRIMAARAVPVNVYNPSTKQFGVAFKLPQRQKSKKLRAIAEKHIAAINSLFEDDDK